MKAKRFSKARRLSKVRHLDIITTLPQTIVETILCLLPIEEAARTSILSREWRYKWTTIPKLVFSRTTVKRSTEKIAIERPSKLTELDWWERGDSEHARTEKELRCKLFYAIHQVLLQRQGPIHEFSLTMIADKACFEIDQIIHHLSRNHTVKKLTFDFYYSWSYILPISFFSSLRHLTDLSLECCDINDKPIFSGSDTLETLYLARPSISGESLLHLLSNCPSLKSLCLFLLGERFSGKRPNIMELFKCLPVIEHLTTWGEIIQSFCLDSVPEELPTSLSHLKHFCFKEISLDERDGYTFGLTFLLVLLKCSPNLEKIELEIDEVSFEYGHSDIYEEYSDVWLEHLNEFKVRSFSNSKSELELLKFILARSPNLKKVKLPTFISDKNEEVELLQSLLRAPRASPVEIFVENRYKTRRNPC